MLRVLTFNIQYGEPVPACSPAAVAALADGRGGSVGSGLRSARVLARAISALGVDVVGMQEVDRGKMRSHGVDQLDVVAQECRMTPLFAQTRRRYGNGLLTRLPVKRARVLRLVGRRTPFIHDGRQGDFLSELKRGRINGWRFKWPDRRACLYAQLDGSEGPLVVGVAHLSTVRDVARRQFRDVLTGFDKFAPGIPAVLIGDMNLRIEHVEEELEKRNNRRGTPGNRFEILHRGNGSPSWAPIIQIDHVVGRGFVGVSSTVMQMPVSDHAAVVVELGQSGDEGEGNPHGQK